ncbi:hypothetical protein [Curtobacterium sp. TXMA1]|uniref:hypothetical protein n=1 Tax=Curtobacterium sp. TXMA1 TaxID=2876939 RepID=UPI001CCFFC66|nr:hypothetical protein [Curtobacterium sp. TXMA1]UBQ02776.1 hypothetical protein LCG91_00975 [Curtobacterium sp. TXMA1]
MSKLLPALDVLRDYKAPTVDVSRLLPTVDVSRLLPAVDVSRLLPALDIMRNVKAPTYDVSRLLPALEAMRGVMVPTFDGTRLRLLDGYSRLTGTGLDAVGALYASLDSTQLLPHLDDAAGALAHRGALRWKYDEIHAAAGALVEDFHTLEPAVQAELEDRTEGARDALSVTDSQLEQSLDLLGVRDALRFYGAAARTPLATFAAILAGSGWYLLSWGSAGDAILVGAGVFREARKRLGALDPDK